MDIVDVMNIMSGTIVMDIMSGTIVMNIADVPNDILENIFNELNFDDLYNVALVCKSWNDMSRYIINKINDMRKMYGTYNSKYYENRDSKYYGTYNKLYMAMNMDVDRLINVPCIPFMTPLNIVKYCVELVKPTINDTVCDLVCGTGSFLVESAIYLHKHNKNIYWAEQQKKIYGYDIDKSMVDLAITNFKMSMGLSMTEQIGVKDTLNHKNKYDVLLMDLPFGSYQNNARIDAKFMLKAMENLELGGRCCIIMPKDILYNNHGEMEKLFEEFNVIECSFVKCYVSVFIMTIIYFINDGNKTDKILLRDINTGLEIETISYEDLVLHNYRIDYI